VESEYLCKKSDMSRDGQMGRLDRLGRQSSSGESKKKENPVALKRGLTGLCHNLGRKVLFAGRGDAKTRFESHEVCSKGKIDIQKKKGRRTRVIRHQRFAGSGGGVLCPPRGKGAGK